VFLVTDLDLIVVSGTILPPHNDWFPPNHAVECFPEGYLYKFTVLCPDIGVFAQTFMWSSWFVMLSDIYGGYSFCIMAFQVKLYHVASKFASAIPDHTSEITLEGKVKDSVPHLTKVGSFSVDVSLEGSIILCRQVDQPGMIGKVGSVLGEENINISFMSVGRISPREHAVMAIGVDDEPPKAVLQKLGGIAAIEELVFLKL
jgi:hypothetical protein